ncbi:hypothetical protein [Spiroplasma sp. SV19]|nr:hypothetical protein [Spiroplasma sp. SV19]WHQ36621.1 hypothetical protein E7Y35_01610 [Spiroplasma sp. SV19]
MWSLGQPVKPYKVFKANNNGKDINVYGRFGDGIYTSNDIIYRWDNNNEPIKPDINSDTGQITNWKG